MPKVTPLTQILHAYGLRRVQLASAAGVNLKTIDKLCSGDVAGMKIATLCRVASALGLSGSDLVPQLARSSRGNRGPSAVFEARPFGSLPANVATPTRGTPRGPPRREP